MDLKDIMLWGKKKKTVSQGHTPDDYIYVRFWK